MLYLFYNLQYRTCVTVSVKLIYIKLKDALVPSTQVSISCRVNGLFFCDFWENTHYMVPLNCNFISTCVISHGTMTILQCIPIMCLHGPCLLVSCNVHILWQHTCGSKRLVVAHMRKFTSRGSTRVEVHVLKVHNSHVITHIPSLSHYVTPIFFWFTSTTNVTHRLFSIVHIKT